MLIADVSFIRRRMCQSASQIGEQKEDSAGTPTVKPAAQSVRAGQPTPDTHSHLVRPGEVRNKSDLNTG